MPKVASELTALQVKRLVKTPGFHAVGGVAGLHLDVKPAAEGNSASWILRKQVGNRRPDLGLGGYPTVTLEQARAAAREIHEQVRQGVDPLVARRSAQDALRAAHAKRITFDEAAKLCHKVKAPQFRNAKHRAQWLSSLTKHASPVIGRLPVADVDLPHVIEVLSPIWSDLTETASRVRGRIEDVIDWATVAGYRSGDNPAKWSGNLEHALPRPSKVRSVGHHAALPWAQLGEFMTRLRERAGIGARALEFAILTAARSGEVRLATWHEIDTEAKLWTIPGERMKAGKTHRVPLAPEALKLLAALPRHAGTNYVFCGPRGKPISDNTLSKLLRDMGVDATPHGFRSTFKDWARSSTAYADEVSELALAHVSSDATRAAYARDELLPKRAQLMKAWAKFCSTTPKAADVVPIRAQS